MMSLLYPFLKCSGDGLTKKEFIIINWGGLRGALAIALALHVVADEYFSIRTRYLFLFHSVGMALLTLLINGTTCATVMNKT